MSRPNLADAVAAKPYPQYAAWWPMGARFTGAMALAILASWRQVAGNRGELAVVRDHVAEYLDLVYQRPLRPELLDTFAGATPYPIWSGEFDALSYGYYRAAFDLLEDASVRHRFTQEVGRHFFEALLDQVDLGLPPALTADAEFAQLRQALHRLGRFLLEEGYLRTHFAFRFVVVRDGPNRVRQTPDDVLARLRQGECAYAFYEMGFPVILPSAVYLYTTVGEAQHHSSRTIEELFARLACRAAESPDFDPGGFTPELVVELWEICPAG